MSDKKTVKRATPKFGKLASHRTDKGTRKFQCNAPTDWEPLLKAIMRAHKFTREADAIRFALGKGLGGQNKVVRGPQVKLPEVK